MINTKETAVTCAIAYLSNRAIGFAQCLGATKLPESQTNLWKSTFDGNPQGLAWLWQIDFEKKILPPDTVNTGNSFSVFVDSATGACGIYWSM